MMSDVFALHQIDDIFGYVGGVISYPLQMSGDQDQFQSSGMVVYVMEGRDIRHMRSRLKNRG